MELQSRSGELKAMLAEMADSQLLEGKAPLLTTICRNFARNLALLVASGYGLTGYLCSTGSNRDGYAPRNETAVVEAAVLETLTALGWNGNMGAAGLQAGGDEEASDGEASKHRLDEWLMGPVGAPGHADEL